MFDIKPSEASVWFHLTCKDFTKTKAFKDKAVLRLKGNLTTKQEITLGEQRRLQRLTDEGQIAPDQFPHRNLPMEHIRVQDNSKYGGPREWQRHSIQS